MEVNESNKISPKITLDQYASSEILKAGTGNFFSGLEAVPTQGAEAPMSTLDSLDSMQGVLLAHLRVVLCRLDHGLYDMLSLHPGVWFLFGCVFIVVR